MPVTAILLALTSVGLWSFFGFIASRLSGIPSTLVVGLSLIVAGIASSPAVRGWRVPWRIHLLGVAGIGGSMLMLFTAFHFAPAVEVNLVNYIWPLLAVVLTPLFIPGSRLRPHHVIGATLGFTGAIVVISAGARPSQAGSAPALGYAISAAGAVVWTCYSLLTKRLAACPTAAVGGVCMSSGLLLVGGHALVAPVVEPLSRMTAHEWVMILLCGLGPMGLAYFTWDAAMKRGDPQVIGSLAYVTPLVSTLILARVGGYPLGWAPLIALALIVGGAVIGSLDMFRKAEPMADGE